MATPSLSQTDSRLHGLPRNVAKLAQSLTRTRSGFLASVIVQ